MSELSRRAFLRTGLVAGALSAGTAAAIEPIRRQSPRFKLSLAAYSFRQALDLRRQPRPEMTLEDFIDLGAGYGLDAVELTGYYFPETSPAYLARLKARC